MVQRVLFVLVLGILACSPLTTVRNPIDSYGDDPSSSLFAHAVYVDAANGEGIPIWVGPDVTIEQTEHAAAVLELYLADRPGTRYGNDKATISNAIVESGAVLLIFDDETASESAAMDTLIDEGIEGQALFGTEIHIDRNERDATYEEIAHFVHVFGIEEGAPDMQAALLDAMEAALTRDDYRPLDDLPEEDWDDEYLALGLEVYYGFWADEAEVGDDEYAYTTRDTMQAGDPALFAIIEGFFPPTPDY